MSLAAYASETKKYVYNNHSFIYLQWNRDLTPLYNERFFSVRPKLHNRVVSYTSLAVSSRFQVIFRVVFDSFSTLEGSGAGREGGM